MHLLRAGFAVSLLDQAYRLRVLLLRLHLEPCVRGASPHAGAGAAHGAEDLAELLADEAVHEEVRRRVDRQQHVRDGVDIAQYGHLDVQHAEVDERHDDAQRQIGDLAHEEDADDDDKHEGHVLAVLVVARQLLAPLAHGVQRAHQRRVERDEREQRSEGAEDEVQDRLVDEEVDPAGAERRLLRLDHVAAARVGDEADLALEEARDVVEDRGDDDAEEGHLGALQAAELHLERLADGDVAVDGDQHHRPHGRRLHDGRERPHVRLHVDEQVLQLRHPVRVVV